MPLSVTSSIEDGFAILDLTGPLTLSPSLSALRQIAKEALATGRLAGMILLVSGVTVVDSAGVGELTVVYTFATRSRCPVMLATVPPGLRNILDITRLDALLPSAENVDAAKRKLKA